MKTLSEQNTKRNLCDTCEKYHDYPYCTDKMKFGDGVGEDNVYECEEYKMTSIKVVDTILKYKSPKEFNLNDEEKLFLALYSVEKKNASEALKNIQTSLSSDEYRKVLEPCVKIFQTIKNNQYTEERSEGFHSFKNFLTWWCQQEGKCYYCGISELESNKVYADGKLSSTKASHDSGTLQIERKNPSKGYTPENCVLSCVLCNNAKSNFIDSNYFEEHFGPVIREYWNHLLKED